MSVLIPYVMLPGDNDCGHFAINLLAALISSSQSQCLSHVDYTTMADVLSAAFPTWSEQACEYYSMNLHGQEDLELPALSVENADQAEEGQCHGSCLHPPILILHAD